MASRKKLKTRAQRQAQAKNQPTQVGIDIARNQAQSAYHTGVSASKGAAKANRQLLNSAQANASNLGLRGLAARQYAADLQGRLEDSHGMVAYDKAQLQGDLQDQLASLDARQAALDAKEQLDAQTLFKAKMQDKRQAQRDRIKAQHEKRTDYNKEVKAALAEIRTQIAKTRGNNPAAHNAERKALKNDPGLRRSLIDYLTTSQSISVPAAKKAVSAFIKRKEEVNAYDKAGYGAGLFGDSVASTYDKNQSWWD